MTNPHKETPIKHIGKPLTEAGRVMILIHGRGASADSILDLARVLHGDDFAYLAPQANMNTWYPQSFLAPQEANQPYLDSALEKLGALVEHVEAAGFSSEQIYLGGFSQGACLTSEFAVRNPKRYGGLLIFSGGVIGPLESERSDSGDFDGTPVFIGCSDVDFHIPVERVTETADILTTLNASVTKKIYPNMGHTINQDEITEALKILAL